ncbi:MAG: hypothetical protein QXW17_03935 [Candidatus Bathyarchaeia archaeon]
MNKTKAKSAFLIAGWLLLIIHCIVFWRRPFDLADMLHHEFFEAIFFTAGITHLIVASSKKRRGY